MKVILSIKPEFAHKIFNGTKRFEFRRSLFKNRDVKVVVVYASSPISKVIGEFEIDEVIHRDLNTLWRSTKDHSGISQDYYYEYFKGKTEGYAIKVKKAKLYKKQKNIRESYGLNPPQSFAYLKAS